MFEIYDGRDYFFQWDLNQRLKVKCNARQVHFCNGGSNSLVVNVENGVADVPNILLQTSGNVKVYAYIVDNEDAEKYTLCNKIFKIWERSKPSDYIYTETETFTVEQAVEQAVEEAKASGAFNGEPGEPGYTPVRGVDYWTDQDQTKIVSDVLSALPVWEGGSY